MNGLKYNLLSVTQIYYKGNKVKFISDSYNIINIKISDVNFVAKMSKSMYIADLVLSMVRI